MFLLYIYFSAEVKKDSAIEKTPLGFHGPSITSGLCLFINEHGARLMRNLLGIPEPHAMKRLLTNAHSDTFESYAYVATTELVFVIAMKEIVFGDLGMRNSHQ